MKNKKYLILLPSLILSSCNFKNTILYLGENILINEERITTLLKKEYKDLNDEFASSNFIMKDFYAILEKDGLNLKTSHKISDVLKKTNKIIKQNLIFSIGVKILTLVLSLFGIADMWQAVFADVGVTLITIFNTLRILK